MSDHAGKIQVLGMQEIKGEKIFILRFIQGRNPKWVDIPFLQNTILKRLGSTSLSQHLAKTNFFLKKVVINSRIQNLSYLSKL